MYISFVNWYLVRYLSFIRIKHIRSKSILVKFVNFFVVHYYNVQENKTKMVTNSYLFYINLALKN
jgi:hypothetical protein